MFARRQAAMKEFDDQMQAHNQQHWETTKKLFGDFRILANECLKEELATFKAMSFEEQSEIMKRKDLKWDQQQAFIEVYVLHGSIGFNNAVYLPGYREKVMRHSHLFTDDNLQTYAYDQYIHYVHISFVLWIIWFGIYMYNAKELWEAGLVFGLMMLLPLGFYGWWTCLIREFVSKVRAREEKDVLLV